MNMLELLSKLNAQETENTVAEHGYAHHQETTDATRESGVYVEGQQGHGFRAGYFTPDGDWYAEADSAQVAINKLRLRLRRETGMPMPVHSVHQIPSGAIYLMEYNANPGSKGFYYQIVNRGDSVDLSTSSFKWQGDPQARIRRGFKSVDVALEHAKSTV